VKIYIDRCLIRKFDFAIFSTIIYEKSKKLTIYTFLSK
jgi:hypothetical protein